LSNSYKDCTDVPTNKIIDRLNELSDAVTKGRDTINREFYMSIPARLDHDADLILCEAAKRLEEFEKLKARQTKTIK